MGIRQVKIRPGEKVRFMNGEAICSGTISCVRQDDPKNPKQITHVEFHEWGGKTSLLDIFLMP